MTAPVGATASHWFMAPHSSDSTWPKLIQRSDSTSMTLPTAAETSGNRPRAPVWKSIGSSPVMRYWLKASPPGAASGTHGRQAVDAVGDLVHVRIHAVTMDQRRTAVMGVDTPN